MPFHPEVGLTRMRPESIMVRDPPRIRKRPRVLLAIETGLRWGELIALRPYDINLTSRLSRSGARSSRSRENTPPLANAASSRSTRRTTSSAACGSTSPPANNSVPTSAHTSSRRQICCSRRRRACRSRGTTSEASSARTSTRRSAISTNSRPRPRRPRPGDATSPLGKAASFANSAPSRWRRPPPRMPCWSRALCTKNCS